MADAVKITFFKSRADFRKWLKAHHAEAQELWVGFYKKDSGRPSITWPQSVDEALCFGWIDGIRKSIDDVKNKEAWKFFQAQTPSYRKATNWWVLSAKKEETRLKRLDRLIEYSAQGQTIPPFTPIRKR